MDPGRPDVVAWKTPFVGDGPALLHEAIQGMRMSPEFNRPYGNFCAILQGSGTGKSRLVDEYAKTVFTIPMVFRDDELGYPPGDELRSYASLVDFTGRGSEFVIKRRYLLFLLKAVHQAGEWIDKWKADHPELGIEDAPKHWREHLSNSRSPNRVEFFTRAVDRSTPLAGFENIENSSEWEDIVARKAVELVQSVSRKLQADPDQELKKGEEPLILFSFDEAHNLAQTVVTSTHYPERTRYQCLCGALTYLSGSPLFALFLSSHPRLSEFEPTPRNFWEYRGAKPEEQDSLHPPFVELPFDIWKGRTVPIVTEGQHSMAEFSSLEFMSCFGRPIFWAPGAWYQQDVLHLAMFKLNFSLDDKARFYPLLDHTSFDDKKLLAPLAVRFNLTFESNRDEAVYLENLLVARNMRIVYSAPMHRQHIHSGYPSEPFLADAAARVIFDHVRSRYLWVSLSERRNALIEHYKNIIPTVITWFTSNGLISKGAKGELIARILVLLAHDVCIIEQFDDRYLERFWKGNLQSVSFTQKVPLIAFLRTLISDEFIEDVLSAKPQNMAEGKTLREAFDGAYIFFTQFVHGGDDFVLDESCYLLMSRGGAFIQDHTLSGVDLVVPVWLSPKKDDPMQNPTRWTMTCLIIQVKDHISKRQALPIDIQKRFEFFTESNNDEYNSRPYLTIAMQFGAEDRGGDGPKGKRKARGESSDSPLPNETVVVSKPPEGIDSCPSSEEKICHPHYHITVIGSSGKVYKVSPKDSHLYKSLLAQKDLVDEHPRQDPEFRKAIMDMKPYWTEENLHIGALVRGAKDDGGQEEVQEVGEAAETQGMEVDNEGGRT